MKVYSVRIPVLVDVYVNVEAEDKEDAKQKALEDLTVDVKCEKSSYSDPNNNSEVVHYEWESHERLVQGNFYYGSVNEIEVTEEEDF